MTPPTISDTALPGLYQYADKASVKNQTVYYNALCAYLLLLIIAASVSFYWPKNPTAAMASALLFLVTLGILIFVKTRQPDNIWYNGRAVTESVKTRAWRWMMRAEPYQGNGSSKHSDSVSSQFIDDLKEILDKNQSLSAVLKTGPAAKPPISDQMKDVRSRSMKERLAIYASQRVHQRPGILCQFGRSPGAVCSGY